jgi:hypothetical protein
MKLLSFEGLSRWAQSVMRGPCALMVINVVTQVYHLRAAANSVEVIGGVVAYMLGVTQ